jgi:hypothetical protein
VADTPKLDAPFEAQFHAGRMQEYIIGRLIRQIHTSDLVKVLAVYPTAGTVGFVDVQPLVQQQTTNNVVLDQAPMFRLPYMRLQGGQSAVIIDPVVGDLGLAVFAGRDITAAVNAQGEAPAATNRAYDAGDGLYLGGFINQDPEQWLQFFGPGGAEIKTPLLTLDAEVRTSGNVSVGTGWSGSFKDGDGYTLTVQKGVIVNKF